MFSKFLQKINILQTFWNFFFDFPRTNPKNAKKNKKYLFYYQVNSIKKCQEK